MSGPALFKVGAFFEGYRITKVLSVDGRAHGSPIQTFSARQASELRLDAGRILYCMPVSSALNTPESAAELTGRVERLKALKLPELPDVENGGLSDGILWVAVQEIRGESLRTMIQSHEITELWPLEACLRLAADIARVLKAASERGILHLDLKPDRVYCTPDLKLIKLTGLGILQLFSQISPAPTDRNAVPYMAPEQIVVGRTVDTRTDIYSLGMLFYEICTLDLPFTDSHGTLPPGEWIMNAIHYLTPEPLASRRKAPHFVDAFLRRLAGKKPERRIPWESVIREAETAAECIERQVLPEAWPSIDGEEKAEEDEGGAPGEGGAPDTSHDINAQSSTEGALTPLQRSLELMGPTRTHRRHVLSVSGAAALCVALIAMFVIDPGRRERTSFARPALAALARPVPSVPLIPVVESAAPFVESPIPAVVESTVSVEVEPSAPVAIPPPARVAVKPRAPTRKPTIPVADPIASGGQSGEPEDANRAAAPASETSAARASLLRLYSFQSHKFK